MSELSEWWVGGWVGGWVPWGWVAEASDLWRKYHKQAGVGLFSQHAMADV